MNNNDVENSPQDELLMRVGQMTRLLHDSLRGLGLDKLLERAAEDIPDARDRLDYVAKMSEKAAQRVLNATDVAIPMQESIDEGAKRVSAELESLLSTSATIEQYKEMAQKTMTFLATVNSNSVGTKAHLMDIMMAQDFQDLTGQLIKKVLVITQAVERELAQILIDNAPPDLKEKAIELMEGPSVPNAALEQDDVDNLLDSLGF